MKAYTLTISIEGQGLKASKKVTINDSWMSRWHLEMIESAIDEVLWEIQAADRARKKVS